MAAAQRRVDWSFGPGHGPVLGVVNAAAAVCWFTMWMWIGHGSAVFSLLLCLVLGTFGWMVAWKTDQPARVLWYRGICWGLGGAWSFWALVGFHGIPLPFTDFRLLTFLSSPASPWASQSWLVLVGGAGCLAAVGWMLKQAEDRKQAVMAPTVVGETVYPAPRTIHDEIIQRWEPYIRRQTKVQVKIHAAPLWPVPEDLKDLPDQPRYYGFTLDVELPEGATIDDLKGSEQKLATHSPEPDIIPDGCGVEFAPHPTAGRRNVIIRVGVVNVTDRKIPYPRDLIAMDTRDNPQPIGVRADGTRLEVPFDRSMILTGDTGSGKSTQENNLIVRAACCSDELLCGIDLTGRGQTFRPWLRAYHEKHPGAVRPTFAYVAPDDHNARILVASLLKMHDARMVGYQDLIREHDEDKIVPRTMGVPGIKLVIDEFKTLPDDIQEMVQTLTETGRKSGIRVISCALEATASYIPPGVRKQSEVRACMKVTDQEQLAYLFDRTWGRAKIDPASLTEPGDGLCAVGARIPEQFKGYYLRQSDIEEISVLTAPWQPDLDEVSLRAGDTVTVKLRGDSTTYTGVWTQAEARTYPLIFATVGATLPAGRGATTTATENAMGTPEDDVDAAMGGVGDAMNEINAQLEALRKAADGPYEPVAGRDEPSADDLNAWFNGPTVDEPTRAKPPAQARVLQLLKAAAENGTGPTELHQVLAREGYPTSRTTVSEWLSQWKAQGIVDQPGGKGSAWFPGSNFPKV